MAGKRRGVPVIPEVFAALKAMGHFNGLQSRNAQVDAYYRLMAIDALKRDPVEYSWLLAGTVEEVIGRRMILAKLGRLCCPAEIRAKASEICRWKPCVREAIEEIGDLLPGSASPSESIVWRLFALVEEFRVEHPDLTIDETLEALECVCDHYADQM